MRKIVFIFIIILTMLITGCAYDFGKTEIEKILFITTIGIDKADDGSEDIIITAISRNVEAYGKNSSSPSIKKSNIIVSRGRTIFEAIRNISSYSDKKIFFGHAEYILMGEKAAQDNLLQYLDLFFREHELRLNSKVIIVKEETAQSLLDKITDENVFIRDYLISLFKSNKNLSTSDEIPIINIMNMLDDNIVSAYIPCIKIKKNIYENLAEKSKKNMIELNGFALFKEEKLFGYITDEMARAFNWIRGKVHSGVIVLKSPSGENISLAIVDSSTKVIPKLSEEGLEINIQINFSTHVTEIKGKENIFKEETLSFLENQQNILVKKQIQDVLSFSKENNLDFFPISEIVYHKYPVKWQYIKDSWKKIFPDIKTNIEVNSVLNRTYDIKEPIRSSYGVKK